MLLLLEECWKRVQTVLCERVGTATYEAWLQGLRPVLLERGKVLRDNTILTDTLALFSFVLEQRARILGDDHADTLNAMTCKAILDSPHFTSHNAADEDGNLALHLAAQRGLRETCGLILASPHFTAHSTASKEGRTALHWAVESDLPNVCNQILASRDFTLAAAKDNRGMTALDIAAVQSKGLFSGEICTALLRYFLETDTLLHWTRDVLRMAIEFGNEDVVAAFAAFEFSATPRFLIPLTPCEQMVLRMSRKTLYATHFATL